MSKIDPSRLLREMDDWAWSWIERAMSAEATLFEVGAAAGAVRAAGALRRKCGASSATPEDIEAEYLTGLSLRLMEIDNGDDLAVTRAVANLISSPRAKQ
jgi:hypothetical protein